MAKKMRTLSLDEIVEEYNNITTVGFNFIGAEEDTGYLLYEIETVIVLPDGSTKNEIIRTNENMDDIGIALYGEDYLPRELW